MILNALAVLLGVAVLLAGLWMAWPPLALIVGGLILLGLGLMREVPDGTAAGSPDRDE